MFFPLLNSLQHINLIKIYGYCLDNLSLVLEYISGGNLAQRLACEDNKPPLSWKSRVSIATAAAKGINFLHEMKYVHRDIKRLDYFTFSCSAWPESQKLIYIAPADNKHALHAT